MTSPAGRRSGSSPQDAGYSWVVLLSTVILNALAASIFASFGIFFPEYVSYFDISKAEAVVVGSLASGVSGLIGVVLGPLAQRFGYRRLVLMGCFLVSAGLTASSVVNNLYLLYVTNGVIPGIGLGCYAVGGTVAIIDYFNKRRSFAFGVNTAGYSIGSFSGPQIARLLIDKYTWKGAVLIFGAISLHGFVFGGLMRPFKDVKVIEQNGIVKASTEEETQASSDDQNEDEAKSRCSYKFTDFFDYTLLKDLKTVLFFLATALAVTGYIVPFVYLPVRAMSYGVDPTRAALLVSILAACSGVCRPLFGWLGDLVRKKRTLIVAISTFLYGIAVAGSFVVKSYIGLAVLAGITGCIGAGFMSNNGAVMGDVAPSHKMAHATGILLTALGGANLVSQPLGGYFIDISGNYAMPFLVYGLVMLVGAAAYFTIFWLQCRERKSMAEKELHRTELGKIVEKA